MCKVTKKHGLHKCFIGERSVEISNLKSTTHSQRIYNSSTGEPKVLGLEIFQNNPTIKGTEYFLKWRRKENGIQSSNKRIF